MTDERMVRRIPASPEAVARLRTDVVKHARDLGVDREVCEALRLAVSEALTNIVVHAYVDREPGDMILEAWRDEHDQLAVLISDEGSGLVPRASSPGLGLGIGIMAQMADGFGISNREGAPGTIVSLRFALGRPADLDAPHGVPA